MSNTIRTALLAFLVLMPLASHAAEMGSFDDIKGAQTDAIKASAKKPEDMPKETDLEASEFWTEFRLGLLNLTGNTQSLSLSGGNHTMYRYKRFENNWRIGGYYSHVFSVRSQAGLTGTVARYIYGTYRFDYYILERLTYYVGGGGYTDRYNGIELSGVGFTGFRYFFLKSTTHYLSGSAGYQFAGEDRVAPSPDAKLNYAVAEIDYWQQLNDHVALSHRTAALEDVVHGYGVRVDSKTELKVNMTKRLALVLGFELKFRNRPVPGFKKLDTITEFLVAAKF